MKKTILMLVFICLLAVCSLFSGCAHSVWHFDDFNDAFDKVGM